MVIHIKGRNKEGEHCYSNEINQNALETTNESDKEVMEQIALSDSKTQDFPGSSRNEDVEKKPRLYNKIVEKFGNLRPSVGENFSVIKRVVQNIWFQCVRGENSDRIRAYQVWPGNNVCRYFLENYSLRNLELKCLTSYAGFLLPWEIHLWPRSKRAAFVNHVYNSFKLDFCHVYFERFTPLQSLYHHLCGSNSNR